MFFLRPLFYVIFALSFAGTAQAKGPLCGTYSKSWASIERNFGATPQALADSYISQFGRAQLGREAQAVFSRMKSDGTGMEEALSAHIEAYHGDKTDQDRHMIQSEVRGQLSEIAEVYQLILFYEGFQLTPEIVDARIRKVASRKSKQPEIYADFLRVRADKYLEAGEASHIALLKAYVEAWNRYELESDMLGIYPLKPGTDCFADELYKIDGGFRSRALKASPIGKVGEPGVRTNKLDYLTSRKFGNYYIMVRDAVFEGARR